MCWLRIFSVITVFLFLDSISVLRVKAGASVTSDAPKAEKESLEPPTSPHLSSFDGNAWNCDKLDACSDKLGFDAIKALHHQLDDDRNGNIDVAESDEFLRDELQYENGYERQRGFHGNDKYISLDELWQMWKKSEVHNWTVEETIEWLVNSVELPQYVKTFQENAVDGSHLPRMAVVSNSLYLTNILGIKDVIHKQKLALKAMDVVLFGPPKHHNYVKDVLLVLSLVIAIGGIWFAYVQHKYSQTHLKKMMKDMDSLQRAEESLQEMQRELDKAKIEQETTAMQKQRLQDEIMAAKQEKELLYSNDPDYKHIKVLEETNRILTEELTQARRALESRSWVPPVQLQHWLQLTHELELKHYNCKKAAAEKQLASAKEGCEKLRRKRSSFLGSFRLAHGSCIDDIDHRILQAKAALSEVTKDLQERLHRWKQIERLCGFPIVHNQGIIYLESVLHGSVLNGGKTMARSGSEGTLTEEDSSLPYASGISAGSAPSMASLNSFRLSDPHKDVVVSSPYERPSTFPVSLLGSNPMLSNGTHHSSTKLSHLGNSEDEEEEDDKDDDKNTVILQPSHHPTESTCYKRPTFTVGDTSPQDNLPKNVHHKMTKCQSHDNPSPPRDTPAPFVTSYSESALEPPQVLPQTSSAPSSNLNSPTESLPGSSDAASQKGSDRATLGNMRKKSSFVAAFKNSFTGVLDEENSTDSNSTASTADDDSLKEKKKKSLFQPLKKKKSKVS